MQNPCKRLFSRVFGDMILQRITKTNQQAGVTRDDEENARKR